MKSMIEHGQFILTIETECKKSIFQISSESCILKQLKRANNQEC